MFARHAILIQGWLGPALLGVIQGATEFLPVSSSGHLALAERLLGLRQPGLVLEIGLHFGTLVAVLWTYRGQLWPGHSAQGTRLWLWLAVGTLPAAAVGLVLRGAVDRLFDHMPAVAAAWCVTGAVLVFAARSSGGSRGLGRMRVADAWWIGVCQAAALVPGISRSGATIVCGLYRGLAPEEAARFSFLLSVPAVAGAVVLQAADLGADGGGMAELPGLLIGMGVAAVTGVWAIGACVRRLRAGAFAPYGYYCLALGALCLLRSAVTGEWQ